MKYLNTAAWTSLFLLIATPGCSSDETSTGNEGGTSNTAGGSTTGGSTTGGSTTAGGATASGGSTTTGGAASGGTSSGGASGNSSTAGAGGNGGTAPTTASCADGLAEETFEQGMVGCSGSEYFRDRASLCDVGHVCTQAEWLANWGLNEPEYNYWTDDLLLFSEPSDSVCLAHLDGGLLHTSKIGPLDGDETSIASPMRICAPSHVDSEGNFCHWAQCTSADHAAGTGNQHFGGCSDNPTAGTLCCPTGDATTGLCADGSAEQTFEDGMVGCAGSVWWQDRSTLCGGDSVVCTSEDWVTSSDGTAPTYHYWTAENLRFSGDADECSVSVSTDSVCRSDEARVLSPMRVCSSSQPDPEGNTCKENGCTATEPEGPELTPGFFGGGYHTPKAGALCCL